MHIVNSDIEMKSSRLYSNTMHQRQEISLEWKRIFQGALNDTMNLDELALQSGFESFLEGTISSLLEKMISLSVDTDLMQFSTPQMNLSEREMDLVTRQLKFFDDLFETLFDNNISANDSSIFKLIRRFENGSSLSGFNGERQIFQKIEWKITTKTSYSYHEKENTRFNTNGTVKTKDGRDINVQLDMDMARVFNRNESSIMQKNGFAHIIDPLILNIGKDVPGLSARTFNFDLDSDGQDDEEIPFLLPGSGFLAFDLNDDGLINNGSELFGPTTGDGFGELAEYDIDNNQWIDENDSIFDQLSLWTKDDEGNDFLKGLEDSGIGAISLKNEDTLFDLKDSQNNLLGQVQKTGIFLNEDGTAKTIQQVNFVV